MRFRSFDRFDPGSNLKGWLYTIMRNAYINSYRKKRREPETVDGIDVEDWFLYTKLAEGGLAPSAETTVLEDLPDEDVRRALMSLPEGSRAVVLLADVEGFSYTEIAEILGIPTGTVMSRLHRARKALEKRLWDVVQERGYVRD
jgi:RNA polymerase sigma-70 factor, ECF subfamily